MPVDRVFLPPNFRNYPRESRRISRLLRHKIEFYATLLEKPGSPYPSSASGISIS